MSAVDANPMTSVLKLIAEGAASSFITKVSPRRSVITYASTSLSSSSSAIEVDIVASIGAAFSAESGKPFK